MIFSIIFSIVFSSCNNLNSNKKQVNEKKALGVWMILDYNLSQHGTDSVVKSLMSYKITDVFLLVKGIAGTNIPEELLKYFIYNSHKNNIKVHLWYVINKDNVFVKEHPDSHIYHCPDSAHNQTFSMTGAAVNLLYPEYRSYVLDNIRYFLSNFDCDGIHLDYIRYSHLVYSWDDYHLKRAASLGCDTSYLLNLFKNNPEYYIKDDGFIELYRKKDSNVVTWVNMRKHIVYDYIKAVKDLMRKQQPEIILSAAFMPEGATRPQWADVQYSQNYSLLSPLLDQISPMAYFKDFDKKPEWIKTVTQNAIQKVKPSCKILTGIQGFGHITKDEFKTEIESAKIGGSEGVIIYKYSTVQNEYWTVIDSLFLKW